MNTVLRHLRRAALLRRAEGPSDADLLGAFLQRRDEAAFEALLRRHGPMVLGVCRRVLGNGHDAEDAFQATFLVLVRKAASVRPRELVGHWLWGVAYRTSLKARAMNAKRRKKEREAPVAQRTSPPANGVLEAMLDRLDEALGRLPEKYRAPLVLCELESRSRKEVARTLGLPEGTLSWRLAQAKKLLARKLSRHGPTLSAGAVAAVLAQGAAPAALPGSLLTSTRKAGLQLAAGKALSGSVPAKVVFLTEGVLKAMLLTKLKVASWAVGVVLLAGAGAVGVSYQTAVAQPAPQARSAYGVAQDANVAPAPKAGRPAADDLESLRLEIEALRKELRATKDSLKALQAEVRGKQGADKAPQRDLEQRRFRDEARRIYEQGQKSADKKWDIEQARRIYEQARQSRGEKTTPDPLAELEDAVTRLRKNPQDKQAAEALDRAMKRLKEQPKPRPRPQGQAPGKQ